MKRFLFIIFAIYLFLAQTQVLAHTNEKSLEKNVKGYFVDIGYTPDDFSTMEPTTFSFSLLDPKTEEEKDFTDIWIRIENDGNTVFATGVKKQSLGATTMIYTFPEKGDYNLVVRYQKDDSSLAETSFPLKVAGDGTASEEFPLLPIFGGMLIGLLGGVIVSLFLKKKK